MAALSATGSAASPGFWELRQVRRVWGSLPAATCAGPASWGSGSEELLPKGTFDSRAYLGSRAVPPSVPSGVLGVQGGPGAWVPAWAPACLPAGPFPLLELPLQLRARVSLLVQKSGLGGECVDRLVRHRLLSSPAGRASPAAPLAVPWGRPTSEEAGGGAADVSREAWSRAG